MSVKSANEHANEFGRARRRDQRGQATAEYALVIVVAAVVGAAVIAWASSTGLFAELFNMTIGRVIESLGGS